MTESNAYRIEIRSVLLALFVFAALLTGGCGTNSRPHCTGNLHQYKDKCLSSAAIEYVGCTEGRGISTTADISGGIGGTFKVVADASLDVAYKKVQQENTTVALEIVKHCIEIVRMGQSASGTEQATVAEYQERVDQDIQQWRQRIQQDAVDETPNLTLSHSSASKGDKVTLEGSNFIPNEMVDIKFNLTVLAQVKANSSGSFSADITVPSIDIKPINYYIIAEGRTSVRSARVPFTVRP